MLKGAGALAVALISLAVVVLAVANRAPVSVTLDPFGNDPHSSATVPLYAVVFASVAVGAVLGALTSRTRRGAGKR